VRLGVPEETFILESEPEFLKTFVYSLLCTLLLVGSAWAETWHTTWEAAARESKRTGKPILMDFTGSNWCGWCKKLKSEVFSTPEFSSWANKHVVLMELDFPRPNNQPEAIQKQNQELSEKYGVQGFPSVLFVNPKGEVLGEYGYDEGGPQVWTAKAEKMLKKK
jgi:protein disulfide-isomerase